MCPQHDEGIQSQREAEFQPYRQSRMKRRIVGLIRDLLKVKMLESLVELPKKY